MIRIAFITIKPTYYTAIQQSQRVVENGNDGLAVFKHVANRYISVGDGDVQLTGLRYERVA
jgi:hypothetical protein